MLPHSRRQGPCYLGLSMYKELVAKSLSSKKWIKRAKKSRAIQGGSPLEPEETGGEECSQLLIKHYSHINNPIVGQGRG